MAEDGCLGQPVRRSARNLSLSLRNREKEEQWGQEGGPHAACDVLQLTVLGTFCVGKVLKAGLQDDTL